jgi:branched-chain amino acid transport system permease protein
MEFVVFSALNGLVYGLLLFMVSAGLTLIFGMMGIVNFAHASFYMLGAYLAFSLGKLFGFWPAIVLSPLLVGLVGALVERLMLRRVHAFGHAHELLLTFGLAYVFEELVKMFYGNYAVTYGVPSQLRFAAFTLFGAEYPFYRVFMATTAIGMFVVLFLLLRGTRVGIIVRAAVRRPAMVGALGHNVPAVFMGVFSVGAWMAGLAGAVGGAFFTTSPNMALELGIIVFVVVVVGGLGSVAGALLASLLIGLLTSFAVGADVSLADMAALVGAGEAVRSLGGIFTLKLSTVAASVPILVMLVVLMLRPSGLMGERV